LADEEWGVVMLASILGSVLLAILIVTTRRARRRERRRDSIARFADARKAMSVTQGRPAIRDVVTPQRSEPGSEPWSVVVQTGSATLFDPIARRRVDQTRKSYRSDPEVLARRPTVAMLPTLLTSKSDVHAGSPAPSHEAEATGSAQPLPLPKSEAS
jgi:hypothetical protein